MVPVAMAKNHQRGALGKARRKRLRATIGLLRDSLIARWTFVKYRASTSAFYSLCSNAGCSKPHTASEVDLRHCEFVQHAWEEGDSRSIPADARSGLMHFIDALRGQLHGSQRLQRAWSKNELPVRADPFLADQSFACHGRRCARGKIANRNVALGRFSRSLENQWNHPRPSIELYLPTKVWTSAPCAPTHKVWTTSPKRPQKQSQ